MAKAQHNEHSLPPVTLKNNNTWGEKDGVTSR
jgi:hypothetical protein